MQTTKIDFNREEPSDPPLCQERVDMDVDGFLSEDAQKGREIVRSAYSDWFALGNELNRFGMSVLQKIEVDRSNKYQVIELVLFLRSLEIFQSVVLMLEVQNASAVKILTRSLLENIFTLVALQKHPDLMESYLAMDEKNTIAILKGFRDMAKESKNVILDVEEINQQILVRETQRNHGVKLLKTFQWAEKAGMCKHYNLYYRKYCLSVHSSATALNDHFDDIDGTHKISFGPSGKIFYEIFHIACLSLIAAISAVMYVFGLKISEELKGYEDRVIILSDSWLVTDT
jgi:hypothetical protein